MDEREFEQTFERLLKHDYSAGTESFRDALLARCLDELRFADGASGHYEVEVSDESLDRLAAAGDLFSSLGVKPE